MAAPRICANPDCDKPVLAAGLCSFHWRHRPWAPRCKVPGCENPHHTKGYCGSHAKRAKLHGDPLAGRTPDGDGAKFLRETALTYDGDECLIWPYGRTTGGYGHTKIEGEQVYAHRWVCEEVNGPPPTPDHQSAHSCGNGQDGCVTKGHLRWATQAENTADTVVHGTIARGERNGHSILTVEDVRVIREIAGTLTQTAIAKQFGVSAAAIANVIHRRNWAWVE